MLTVEAVEQVLLGAGELRATRRLGGFRVSDSGEGIVSVRWQAPAHDPRSGSGISFLETYAVRLRDAGIRAILHTGPPEPRVICTPDAREAEFRGADRLVNLGG